MFRTIIWLLLAAIVLIIMLPVGLLIRLFEHKENYQGPNKIAVWIATHIVPTFVRLAGCDYEITGTENIPNEPALFVGNHQGALDTVLVLFALGKTKIIMAKKEAEKIPIVHLWMSLLRCIFIDRKDLRQSLRCIHRAERYIQRGHSVLIFPEGTRSRGPKMNPFKHGTFKVALNTGSAVVPFVIDGSYKVLEEQKRLIKTKVKFSILPKVMPLPGERSQELAERVQGLIEQELERLRHE